MAIPLLLVAEAVVGPRLTSAGLHFLRAGFIPQQDYPAVEQAIDRVARRRESVWATLSVRAADNMKAFPPAREGMAWHVLQLPKQDDESAFKAELIVGKTVRVDQENRYFFGGKIETETIEGWGFPRYNVSKLGPMAGTRMATGPNAPKANRFVSLGGELYLIRYNSRLPIVVYVPEGVEVRYRIWRAQPEMKVIKQG